MLHLEKRNLVNTPIPPKIFNTFVGGAFIFIFVVTLNLRIIPALLISWNSEKTIASVTRTDNENRKPSYILTWSVNGKAFNGTFIPREPLGDNCEILYAKRAPNLIALDFGTLKMDAWLALLFNGWMWTSLYLGSKLKKSPLNNTADCSKSTRSNQRTENLNSHNQNHNSFR